MNPSECKRQRDVLELKESVTQAQDWWMMIQHDGSVIITNQKKGYPTLNSVTIPRHVFNKFSTWYQKEQD